MNAWLHGILDQVRFEGWAVVNKAQLLESVGYVNDAAGAWQRIAEEYEALSVQRRVLYHAKLGDRVLLSRERLQRLRPLRAAA